jgi:hypothetical protein
MPNDAALLPADAERLAELRAQIKAGPVTLEQAAATLGTTAPDLMAALIVNEVRKTPGAAAIVTGADGVATVKPAGDGEFSITLPTVLAQIVLVGLLHDPSAQAAICAPLPASSSNGVH